MAVKVTWDINNKIIVCKPGVIELDVQVDLYSDGKEDWVSDPALITMIFPLTTTGGDETQTGQYVGDYYFLEEGWKIRPQEAHHTLTITGGNLYVRGGGSIVVPTLGPYTVLVVQERSNLALNVETGSGSSSAMGKTALILGGTLVKSLN